MHSVSLSNPLGSPTHDEMAMFKQNDPANVGTLLKAWLSLWRIETLDSWEAVMRVNMFGCDVEPSVYPVTSNDNECTDPFAWGWFAVAYFLLLVVIGGLVLPTVLIGVVAIAFEKSSQKNRKEEDEVKKVVAVCKKARLDMPDFFQGKRIEHLKNLFDVSWGLGDWVTTNTPPLHHHAKLSLIHLHEHTIYICTTYVHILIPLPV